MTSTEFRSINERPRGYSRRFVITADDLTEAQANTAQEITLITLPAGTVVKSCAYYMPTAFEDASDNALNTTTLIVGDAGDADRFIDSTELNKNGTEIIASSSNPSKVPYAYAASTAVVAKFGSMAAKKLSDVDTGEIRIFLETSDLTTIS